MHVFRSRAGRGHHDHHTNVSTTNGTRVITTNAGHSHGHRGGATVVTVPAKHVSSRHGHRHAATGGTRVITTNDGHGHHGHGHGHGHGHQGGATVVALPAAHGSSSHGHRGNATVIAANVPNGHEHAAHVTSSRDYHGYYRDDPSTIHGFWNKVLGTLTGNRRRRRHGDREMRKARERRDALRIARGVQREHRTGHMHKLRRFRDRHRRRRQPQEAIVIAQDSGRDRTPWLHHTHRTLPPYHGMHHRILGFFTRGKERHAMGKAMAEAAEEERRRERRHRRQEMEDLGRRYRARR